MAPQQLPVRRVGKNGPEVSALGFGLMGLSTAYGKVGPDEERFKVLDRAWELGYTNWDSADMYGDNEDLIGKWFKLHPERRQDIFLATKFGLKPSVVDGKFAAITADSTPEYCLAACETSLKRLGLPYIDLYYVHRVDGETPIEKTIEALAKLKKEGKIKYLGISSCSSATLRRACAVEHIDAVQVEYNPWSLEIEGEEGTNLLQTCRELGVAVFAYSPLGRGFLTGRYKSPDDFEEGDFRKTIHRFSAENFPKNLALVEKFNGLAAMKGCTTSQLVLAWLMTQGRDIFPIPGTKSIKYMEENVGALKIEVTADEDKEIRKLVDECGIAGSRTNDLIAALDVYGDTPELK